MAEPAVPAADLDHAAIEREYGLLTALDGKASALLAFNAIFVTAISVWLGYVPLNWLHLALDLVFLVALVSSALLLSVVRLVWADDDDAPARDLRAVRMARSRRHRAALRLSQAAVAVTLAVAAVHTVGTALTVADACGPRCERLYDPAVFGNIDYRGGH